MEFRFVSLAVVLMLSAGAATAQTGFRNQPLVRPSASQPQTLNPPPTTMSMTQRETWLRRFLHRDTSLAPTLRFSLAYPVARDSWFSAEKVDHLSVDTFHPAGYLALRPGGSVQIHVPEDGRYLFDCHVGTGTAETTWQWEVRYQLGTSSSQTGTASSTDQHVLFVVDLPRYTSLRFAPSDATQVSVFYECNANRFR
jgi:hypothetical protein